MKKLKNALVALVLVFCTFALVACGGKAQLDQEASVSKKGFVASNKEEVTAVFEGDDAPKYEGTGFQFTMTMTETVKGETQEIILNGYVTGDKDGNLTGIAVKIQSGDTFLANAYYKDGYTYLYAKIDEQEVKFKAAEALTGDTAATDEEDDFSLATFQNFGTQLAEMIQMIFENTATQEVEGLTFEKAIKGDNARYHVGLAENDTTEAKTTNTDVYIEIQKNTLVGLEANVNTTTKVGKTTNETAIKFATCVFEKEIKFPSFKDYKEVNEAQINLITDQFQTILGAFF